MYYFLLPSQNNQEWNPANMSISVPCEVGCSEMFVYISRVEVGRRLGEARV